jgi:Trypsin-like serine proteases, typically periplasmic, contain C-terminal PDZ domain
MHRHSFSVCASAPSVPLWRALAGLLLLLACGIGAARASDWNRWVVKVEATHRDGSREIGSAVVVAPQRMVTNCHVVNGAQSIRVMRGDKTWTASADAGDSYRDLCFLRVADYVGAAAPMAEPDDARVGADVFAVGYPDGKFKVSSGAVKGLYSCECDGGRVIQTSAAFDPGASGGGLFDARGQLIGILTFKAVAGGDFHFAVPTGWMKRLGTLPAQRDGPIAFWAHPGKRSAYFLAACNLDSQQKWQALSKLSRDWTRHEPYNPEAWMAAGHASLGLHRLRDAAHAFRQALALDSTRPDASWELAKLELEPAAHARPELAQNRVLRLSSAP